MPNFEIITLGRGPTTVRLELYNIKRNQDEKIFRRHDDHVDDKTLL